MASFILSRITAATTAAKATAAAKATTTATAMIATTTTATIATTAIATMINTFMIFLEKSPSGVKKTKIQTPLELAVLYKWRHY